MAPSKSKRRRRSAKSKVTPFTAPEARAAENALMQYLFNLRSAEVRPAHRTALAFTVCAAEAALAKVQARVEEHGNEARAITDDPSDDQGALLGGGD